jgi:hypothetical protein
MDAYLYLFEFLAELIDVQIKKYSALAQFGVGPDAGPNALLVANQLERLLEIASSMDKVMQDYLRDGKPGGSVLNNAFSQIYFYIMMEYLRAHAGWLMDKNNIHTPVYDRVADQKNALDKMAEKFDLAFDSDFIKTAEQQQCEYDSHAIAYKILNFAIELKQNPQMEFPAGTPEHVQVILRRHIATPTSRYNQEEIWLQIQDLHKQCKEHLSANPSMTQTTEILSHAKAQQLASSHKNQLNELLTNFKKINPNSVLFKPDHQWHTVKFEEHDSAASSTPTTRTAAHHNRYALYGSIVAAAAISLFIYNLIYNTKEDKPAPGAHW